jgi:hypothetical protein
MSSSATSTDDQQEQRRVLYVVVCAAPPASEVRELVARERATGIRLAARDVAAAAGISERRAYELLRAVRTEDQQP